MPDTLADASSCVAPKGIGFVIGAGCGQVIVGVVFPEGFGFPEVAAVDTPPHDISIAQAGIKSTSEIRGKKTDLFRTRHLRPKRPSQNGLREKKQWLRPEIAL